MIRTRRIRRLKESLTQFPDVAPPSLLLLASEPRAVWEFWAGVGMFWPLVRLAPKGHGEPVLVIPGLGASDLSTSLLRRFLDALGYVTYPWGMGRNKGVKDELESALSQRLEVIHAKHGQAVSIIGQSLGGVFARELARMAPDKVRQVITLGSPIGGHPLATTGHHLYEWLSGDRLENMDFNRHLQIRVKPPVPTTAVYSRLDGVVSWQCAMEQDVEGGESIHLRGNTHCGMASSPTALYLIAERLASGAAGWSAYRPRGLARLAFGTKPPARRRKGTSTSPAHPQ
ncbi:alpha/beta hydrolase [Curvibacter sp. APW13]|uniref:esterase/lipase family protein n=1 Tax=Curvibacter sp. APW13 TaxID=3077236 RepID=UPI0028DE1DAB|nr:alpha/beta hydrolase [Curvibacter sp. APW13]MDT8991694.1 alpha/beta hydrolase [Curvibacter sp. APW13]